MKKVLALVLAVMMMATVAFAADAVNPGSGTNNTLNNVLPGSKIKIGQAGIQAKVDSNAESALEPEDIHAVNSTNYTITGVKYTEGKALVESIAFDDANDQVVIKLKQDYTLTTAKSLIMEFTLKGKKVGKNPRYADVDVRIDTQMVAYTLADGKANTGKITIAQNGDVDVTAATFVVNTDGPATTGTTTGAFCEPGADEFLWKVVKDDTTAYGDLEFTAADGDTDVVVRVYDGDKLYLYSNVDADTDVLKKYADADADITFLNFPGSPTFNSTASVYFYKEEGTYIYANNNGVLTPITSANAGAAGQTAGNVKWDDDEGGYVLKTRTLGNYVFSDKPLNVSSASAATTNPDTGANDVVGVATALAAVALVSAAAVSLKK